MCACRNVDEIGLPVMQLLRSEQVLHQSWIVGNPSSNLKKGTEAFDLQRKSKVTYAMNGQTFFHTDFTWKLSRNPLLSWNDFAPSPHLTENSRTILLWESNVPSGDAAVFMIPRPFVAFLEMEVVCVCGRVSVICTFWQGNQCWTYWSFIVRSGSNGNAFYLYRAINSDLLYTLSVTFYLLSRQITLYISLCATYFAVPLVVGRLNYKSVTKPCVVTDHFNSSYSHFY